MNWSTWVTWSQLPAFWPEMLASVSLLPLLQRSPVPPMALPLCEWTLSPQSVSSRLPSGDIHSACWPLGPGHWVFALDLFRCTMWRSLWARAWASPASLKLYKQALDTEAKEAILEFQEIYAVTLSNKNTQGKHFSCSFFTERQKASCKDRHWISHLHGVPVTIPLTCLKLRKVIPW